MKDVQFLSELLIVIIKGDITGFDQTEITEYYAKYDDLNDLDMPFDEEQIKQQFDYVKKQMLELERIDSIISKFARDFTNFYSLWALLTLHSGDLQNIKEFVAKYSEFMEEVSNYKDEEYLTKVIDGVEQPKYNQSLKYYQNSRGASTEAPQRKERMKALVSTFISN